VQSRFSGAEGRNLKREKKAPAFLTKAKPMLRTYSFRGGDEDTHCTGLNLYNQGSQKLNSTSTQE